MSPADKSPESNNPLSGSGKEPQRAKPTGDAFRDIYGDHRELNHRPNRITNALSRIALAGAAIVGGASAIRATTDNPAQVVKDAQTLGRVTTDTTIKISKSASDIAADVSRKLQSAVADGDKKDEPIQVTPTSSPEHQGAVPDEGIYTEKNDLSELTQTTDAFVEDLKKVPAAIMMSLETQSQEGVKITLHDKSSGLDKTVKFVWTKDEYQDKLTISIETDENVRTYTLAKKENLVTKITRDKKPENDLQEPLVNSSKEIVTALNTELIASHQQWLQQRVSNGENITPSTESIPESTNP